MSYTQAIHYASVVTGLMRVNKRWINSMNAGIEVSGNAHAGSITVPVLTTATAGDVTPGTIPTTGINNSHVVLTVGDKIVPYVVQPSEKENFFNKDPRSLAAIASKAADSLMQACETAVIASLVAATPNKVVTLASGHMDFALGTTTPADFAALLSQSLGQAVGNVASLSGGFDPSKICIVASIDAFGNLFAMADSVLGLRMIGDQLTYKGVPIYCVNSTSTSWGGASVECAFVMHNEAMAVKMGEVEIQGNGVLLRSDGTYALHFVNPYYQGVANVYGIASILNGAS